MILETWTVLVFGRDGRRLRRFAIVGTRGAAYRAAAAAVAESRDAETFRVICA